MYLEYFHLKEAPFSISPDPRYLYLSEQHREALGHLLFGVERDGGFILLTGEVGTGKTTICQCLLDQLPAQCDTAIILNPRLTVRELLSTVCDEFRIAYPGGNRSVKMFVDRINDYLLDAHAKGRRAVLIIDEAQNLSPAVLEQIRLLTNLETTKRKLLQVILLGQPELRDLMTRPELRQLSQRIIARHHLGPLTRRDVEAYVKHRLTVAGTSDPLFSPTSIGKLFALSGGIPRIINIIADRALLGAYAHNESRVTPSILKRAAREIMGPTTWKSPWYRIFAWGSGFLFVILTAVIGWALYRQGEVVPLSAKVTSQNVVQENAPPVHKTIPAMVEPSPPNPVEEPAEIPPSPAPAEHGNPQQDLAVSTTTPPPPTWIPERLSSASERTAFRALFKRWSVSVPLEEGRQSWCQEAEKLGLLCYAGKSDLDELLRLNHPAVLKLFQTAENPFFAALLAVEGSSLSLAVGGKAIQIDRSELLRHWRGEYTLFWRPPPQYQGKIHLGDKGQSIAWVRFQLSIFQGQNNLPAGQAICDSAMVKALKQFQSEQGLRPDGIAGPQTLIRLNALTGLDVPLLAPIQKGG
jgi:general secretion pathway protein A